MYCTVQSTQCNHLAFPSMSCINRTVRSFWAVTLRYKAAMAGSGRGLPVFGHLLYMELEHADSSWVWCLNDALTHARCAALVRLHTVKCLRTQGSRVYSGVQLSWDARAGDGEG